MTDLDQLEALYVAMKKSATIQDFIDNESAFNHQMMNAFPELLAMARENEALRAALHKIASCDSNHHDDVVAVARRTLETQSHG